MDNFIDGKMVDEHGYVMYRSYDNNVHVLMGSYTDKNFRGKGIFKTLLNEFLNNVVKKGDVVYIALTNKNILPYLLGIGFERINSGVPYWGEISNGISLKRVKK